MNTLEILQAVRKRLSDPKHWAQHYDAYTADGMEIAPHHPKAFSWCLGGAVAAELDEPNITGDHEAYDLLSLAMFGYVPVNGKANADWNDSATHAEVLEVIDAAIKLAAENT